MIKKGEINKMELINFSERCVECICKTCQKTYQTEDAYDPCYRWCIEFCKGTTPVMDRLECQESI